MAFTKIAAAGIGSTGTVTLERLIVTGSVETPAISGAASTANVRANSLVVSGVSTLGNIVATTGTFSGNVSIAGTLTYEDVTNIDSVGLITARSGVVVNTGTATTALVVNGSARITGILTIGTSSVTLDGTNNQVNVGTGVTIHHTNGVQVGGNTVHSTGLTVNQVNAIGIITASSFRGDGSQLTGIAATTNVRTNSLVVSGVSTFAAGSVSAPSISPTGDSNTGLFFPAADTIAFAEGGAESARFDSSGNLLIGGSASTGKVVISTGHTFSGITTLGNFPTNSRILIDPGSPGASNSQVFFGAGFASLGSGLNSGFGFIRESSGNWGTALAFYTHSTSTSVLDELLERIRINSSGDIVVGTQTARSSNSTTARVHIEGTDQNTSAITVIRNSNDANEARIIFGKSRSTGVNGVTGISSADNIGRLEFNYANGSNIDNNIAYVQATNYRTGNDGNPTGGLSFGMKPDSASSQEGFILVENGSTIFGGGRGTGTGNGAIDNRGRGIVNVNGNRRVYRDGVNTYVNPTWIGGGYNNGGYGWLYSGDLKGQGGIYVAGGYFVGSHGENIFGGACGIVGLGGNSGTYTSPGSGGFFEPGFTGGNGTGSSGNRGGNYAFGGRAYQYDVLYIDRTGNDGTLITLRQDGTQEGTISVSGTTVSYNGGHLSRWSQIYGIDPYNKDTRPEILLGTVMSNLDEMCEWITPEQEEVIWTQEEIDRCMSIYGQIPDGVQVGDVKIPYSPEQREDNWQLNKTIVSNIENDKKVAGVFQSWDDDDNTWVNDYYLAMTGDFVIRISSGVSVENGDLLTSAGDGTAKPQSDDLIRSSTIAKVTSNHVVTMYDDGSYCVPCVLMAC